MRTKTKQKPTKSAPKQPESALEEALAVKALVKTALDEGNRDDMAKLVDSYARAANVVRQLEKDRKRSLASFSDDEVIEYVRGLPDRRRDAFLIAVQGKSLAGKPLFGP